MPKGMDQIDSVMLDRFRAKAAQVIRFSLNSNKNYEQFSLFIFENTRTQISQSTLRRLFQYNSSHVPTKSTLDLVSRSLGFVNWDDFVEKEITLSQYDLLQLISAIQLGGIPDRAQVADQIVKFRNCSDLFNLLDVVAQALIAGRDVEFLGRLFDLPDVFSSGQDALKIYFFVHNLVFRLNQAGLMSQLIPYYGASDKAQVFLVEWYVDEDNLNGYYYNLLQEYHKHKTGVEADLFYNCLMYQHALINARPTQPWVDLIRDFVETEAVHPIPKARRLAVLMLETAPDSPIIPVLKEEVSLFFSGMNEDDKIVTGLIMARLLYLKSRTDYITFVLSHIPDIVGLEKNIWTRININQLRVYRACSCLFLNDRDKARVELEQFDLYLINNFVRNIILSDYRSVLNQLEQS